MKAFAKFIIKIFGWKIVGSFPEGEKKTVVVMAPHTSNWDIFLGKLYMLSKGITGSILVKKEFFIFPLNLVMKMFNAIPVDRGNRKNNMVDQVAKMYSEKEELHLVIAAEGTRKKIDRWKLGFFHIASKSEVPIVVSYLDYEKKEVGIKGVIYNNTDIEKTMKEVSKMYKGLVAKFPENHTLDKRYS